MKKLSKLVSLMLSAVLCLGMAAPAFAIEYDIGTGRVHVENNDVGNTVSWQENHETYNSKETASPDETIVITGTYRVEGHIEGTAAIDVGEDVKNTTITLKGVQIDSSKTGSGSWPGYYIGEAAFSIAKGSDITIELEGSNSLRSGVYRGGIELGEGASVTIKDSVKSADGTPASLYAYADSGAGIGGGGHYTQSADKKSGNITIKDGAVVTAVSNDVTALGGAVWGGNSVGNILITGGAKVTANSLDHYKEYSCIGGEADSITIDNATVITSGGLFGIGAGSKYEEGKIDSITIEDSSVTIQNTKGAAIGSGRDSSKITDLKIAGNTRLDCNNSFTDGTIEHRDIRFIDAKGALHFEKDGLGSFSFHPRNGEKAEYGEDGSVKIPANSCWFRMGYTRDFPNGAVVDKDGNIISTTVAGNEDGSVTVTTTTEKPDGTITKTVETIVKVPEGTQDIKTTPESSTPLPEGSKITGEDGSETTYPEGAEIDKDGNVTGSSVTKKDNDDGSTTITNKDENGEEKAKVTVEVPDGQEGSVKVDGNGTTTIPDGSKTTDEDGNETTYPEGTTLDKDGKADPNSPSVTKDKDGNVTIDDGKGNTSTITKDDNGDVNYGGGDGDGTKAEVPEDKKDDVKVDVGGDGSVTVDVPGGTVVTDKDGNETTYPDGTTLDKDGKADPNSSSVTKDKDGNVTIDDGKGNTSSITKDENGDVNYGGGDGDGTKAEVPEDKKDDVKVDVGGDGSVTVDVPGGTVVTDKDGNETTYPEGTTLDENGKPSEGSSSVTKDKDGNVTIDDGKGNTSTITKDDNGDVNYGGGDGDGTKAEIPDGKKDDVKVEVGGDGSVTVEVPGGTVVTDKDGSETTYPNGTTLDEDGKADPESPSVTKDKDGNVTIKDSEGNTIIVEVPSEGSENVVVNPDGSVDGLPAGTVVTDKDGNQTTYPNGGSIGADGTLSPNAPDPDDSGSTVDPVFPSVPDSDTGAGSGTISGGGTTAIEDQEVPLAGLVSRGLLLAQLYIHEGSPDGEDAEGEYAKALAWAVENEIVDEDADPEEIVTVAILRGIMTRYAKLLEVTFDVEIPGEDDEIVMNCDEILEKFSKDLEEKAA